MKMLLVAGICRNPLCKLKHSSRRWLQQKKGDRKGRERQERERKKWKGEKKNRRGNGVCKGGSAPAN